MGAVLPTSTTIADRMARARFPIMGTTGEIIVPEHAVLEIAPAIGRLEQLERTWSRFIPDSEISRLNAAGGASCRVSEDTLLLVELANESWRLTGGLFDAMLLHPLRRAGYDDDFERLPVDRLAPTCSRVARPGREIRPIVDHAARTVTVPRGAGFDPGGIGKGLAADLVAERLIGQGVDTGVVNLGGDLRLWGAGPHDDGWHVGLPDRTVAVTDAGVATSGTTERTWHVAGMRVHHLIDPCSGRSGADELESVAVVAATAWLADVIALAAALTSPDGRSSMLSGLGVEGVVVATDGSGAATPGMCAG